MNKNLFYLIIALVSSVLWSHAAPLDRLPVATKEEVGLNMLDRATSLSVGNWSESQTSSSNQETYKRTRNIGVGLDGISSVVNSMSFRLVVANTNDSVYTWIHVDTDQETILYANAVRRIVSSGTPNIAFAESVRLEFEFVYDPTIKVPDARSAVAYQIDKDGSTKREVSLDVSRDGVITIPVDLIGKAIYEVRYNDGSSVLYGLDGNMLTPTTVIASVSVGFRNGVVVKNRDVEIFNIPSYSGHGDNKFVHLVLDSTRKVGFEFSTSEGAYAIGIKYRKAGREHADDPWLEAHFENKRDGVMELEAGDWYIEPVWDPEQFSPWPRTYTPPDNGGGKD